MHGNVLAAFAGGLALGGLFFGGLLLTVARLSEVRSPLAWAAGSFALRAAAVVAGVWYLSGGAWAPAVSCLVGFIVMRYVVTVLVARTRQV